MGSSSRGLEVGTDSLLLHALVWRDTGRKATYKVMPFGKTLLKAAVDYSKKITSAFEI